MSIFEKASKQALRFKTSKGYASTEDLWQLSLTDLDTIGRAVMKQIKEESEESLLTTRSNKNETLELRLEIIKRIIQVKQEEKEAQKVRAERLQELSILQELSLDKKLDELKSLSKEDVDNRIAEIKSKI